MWILPKTLTQSNGSLATAETISDLNECSQICASSLLVRSKSSPSKTFLRRWKQDSWRLLPYGRIAKPSLGNHSLIERTFSLRPILAPHSAQPASDKALKTSGISGHTFTDGYYAPDLFSSSSRMSKDTYRWDSPQSSAIWKKEVIKRRGAFSARLKLARLIKGSGSLSWPTATATDSSDMSPNPRPSRLATNRKTEYLARMVHWPTVCASEVRQGFQDRSRGMKGSQESLTTAVILHGQAAPASSNTSGSRQGLWQTPKATNADCPVIHNPQRSDGGQPNLAAQMVLEQQRQALWLTPRANEPDKDTKKQVRLEHAVAQWGTPAANDANKTPHCEVNSNQAGLAKSVGLELQRQWGTPTARDHKSGRGNEEREHKELTPMVERQQSGKLNPRWVETLMGLPIGWTMPSCTSPQTIAPMSCDSSATELCLPPQSELSEFSLASWPSPRAGESQQTEELSRLWVENGFKQPKTRGGKARANGSTFDVTLETAARGVAAMEAKP